MKYYVLSDVHGHYSVMMNALQEKNFFDDPSPHKLILCGDILDKGEETKEMVDFIVSELQKDEIILIRGNHEDLFVEMVERFREEVFDYVCGDSVHIENGTFASAKRLVQMDDHEALSRVNRFRTKIKQTDFYQTVLPACRDYYETKNYVFVHGYIPIIKKENQLKYNANWRNANEKEWKEARWLNGAELHATGIRENGKTIVCGHYSTSYAHWLFEGRGSICDEDADFTPYYADGIIAIDACTVYSKSINVIVLEDDER